MSAGASSQALPPALGCLSHLGGTQGSSSPVMMPCLVKEGCVLINKSLKEKAQGLRQHLGCKNRDFAGVSLAGSQRGEKSLEAAVDSSMESSQGLQKPGCRLPGKSRSFSPLGLSSARSRRLFGSSEFPA